MEVFLNADAWISFNFNVPEIVLGIDNIIFISIATGKLPEESAKKATKIGIAMFMRIILY
jgi:predicted tellurium resistance membrane protein TerC